MSGFGGYKKLQRRLYFFFHPPPKWDLRPTDIRCPAPKPTCTKLHILCWSPRKKAWRNCYVEIAQLSVHFEKQFVNLV
jgi:hypothetical protein